MNITVNPYPSTDEYNTTHTNVKSAVINDSQLIIVTETGEISKHPITYLTKINIF